MKIKNTIVLCLIVFGKLVFPDAVFSQPYVDIVNFKTQYYQAIKYVDFPKNKLEMNQQCLDLLLPLEMKNKNVILIGFEYNRLNFSLPEPVKINEHLQSTSLQLGYEFGWKNKKWRSLFMFIPKMNSDLKNKNNNGFQAGGAILLKYQKKENLSYHFGAYYNREFFGDYFLPLLGIDWRINKRLNLFGDLPSNLNLEYKFGNSFYAGFEYYSTIGSFRSENSILAGDYIRDGDKFFGHNELRIYLNLYVSHHVVIYAAGGRSFFHFYEQYNSDHKPDPTNSVFRKSDDGLLMNAGIAYRFRLDTNKK